MMNDALQVALVVLSAAAIWLVARPAPWYRWGFVVGLASQPLWLYSTFAPDQWGMFVLALFYTWAWGSGVWEHFFKRR